MTHGSVRRAIKTMIRRVYHPVKCNPRDPGVSEGEVVVVMWSVSFRVKWWWMLRTRRGLASWGMDTYPPVRGITGG
jgi:hypothetical protein